MAWAVLVILFILLLLSMIVHLASWLISGLFVLVVIMAAYNLFFANKR